MFHRAHVSIAHQQLDAFEAQWQEWKSIALRAGGPEAHVGRVKLHASFATHAPPIWPGLALRALAYAADACGREADALWQLQRAESMAEQFDQRIDSAIARFQRGLRLGGRRGREMCEQARTQMQAYGGGEAILREDVGLR
ncbi:MAG: hypothetical protein ACOC1F_05255 [Myxococcota bacterium]